jgi:hypothetical protein
METPLRTRPVLGIDVGKRSHWACLVTAEGGNRPERPGREQGARPRRALPQSAERRPRGGGTGPQHRVVSVQEDCGLAPRNRQSGTSISSATASRQGNKRLKNLLIFSCNSLVRSDNRFDDFYRKCRDRGRRTARRSRQSRGGD